MDKWPLDKRPDSFVVITLRQDNGNVVQECKSDKVRRGAAACVTPLPQS